MSTVENVSNDTNVSQSSLNNGKRSFIITVDDNGKIEVQPSGQREQVTSPKKMHNGSCKSSKKGKQRIRIALLEENTGSSDTDMEDSEETNDMISIDARSLETMHDRYVKIYNKKLRGKPSFVVLEDALIRKRMEETLQTPSNHSHAEQQTTPADMSAHMGSQTDEFLLQCALRATTLNKGRSRGCQATDVSCTLPKCAFCQCAANGNNINVPSLRRLSEMCAVQMANKLKQTPTVATNAAALNERAEAGTTPHVTISFLPVAAQKASTISAQQQSPKQQQFLPATNCAHSCANCPHLQPTGSYSNCCKCCHCCQQQQQQQQQFQAYAQQQHPGPAATFCHCCNSCCLLKPTMAQTMLGFGHAPVIPSHCSHHMLPTPDSFALQQTLQPVRGCSSPCLCYRTPTASMTTCNIPHCLHRQMQPHSCITLCNDCQQQQLSHHQEQQQLQQQQQKLLQHQNVCPCNRSCVDAKLSNMIATKSSKRQLQSEDSKNPVNNKPEEPKAIIQQDIEGDIEADIQADILADAHQDVHEDDDAQESAGRELHCNVSQTTVRHMKTGSYKRKSEQKSEKEHHSRNKMGSSCPAGKLFMARFGRTCLILKPTSSTAPPRLLTSRICRYTWSNKLEKN